MFSKILIANRGEIAVRIIRACREMGISTVAIYSQADKDAMHVQLADESYCVGGNRVADSYLNIPAILTVPQLAKFLGIGQNKAYALARSKQLDVLKIGNTIRIPRHALLKYLGADHMGDG